MGQKEGLGFPATLKNLRVGRAAGHGAGRKTSLPLAGAGPAKASKPGGKQCGLGSDPRYPCPGDTAFGCKPGPDITRGVLGDTSEGWVVPELEARLSMQIASYSGLSVSLNPIGVVHRQAGFPVPSLPQAQLALCWTRVSLIPTGAHVYLSRPPTLLF